MAKKQSISERMEVPRVIYTKEELALFDQKLNQYKREVTNDAGEKVMILDWETIYIKAGVKSAKGVLVYEKPDGSTYIPLVEFENKIDQWQYWRSGLEYGQSERYKSYQKSDEQLSREQAQRDFDNF